jgi:uncharacterized membrane protein
MEETIPHKKTRIKSIDFLRGIVMILMPLDHIRDFMSNSLYSPTNISHTTVGLFFTRYLANYCAPIFIFLAGTSMYLWHQKIQSTKKVSAFLFSRGLFLILLELTIIRTVWAFNFDLNFELCQIFWAIGFSMIFLSVIIYLPYFWIFSIGIIIVAGHNLLDYVHLNTTGPFTWLFQVLHGPAETQIHFFKKLTFQIEDPLLPWIGVMSLGYIFGKLYTFEWKKRRNYLWLIGLISITCFVILRLMNNYGNHLPWSVQKNGLFTFMSFINCEKYPPSLAFLLMYLGIAILSLILLEKITGKIADFFITFGKVPLAYYVVHVFYVHLIAVILALITYGQASWLFGNHCLIGGITDKFPQGYGYGLPIIYLIWFFVVITLYPFCKWYGNFKLKHKNIKFLRYI